MKHLILALLRWIRSFRSVPSERSKALMRDTAEKPTAGD